MGCALLDNFISMKPGSRVARLIGSVLFCMTSLISLAESKAQGNSAALHLSGTSAVDAKGKRHYSDDYPNRRPPWMDDQIRFGEPLYPNEDLLLRHEGKGLFRLTLDLKTGYVGEVTVMKSTGFRTLDESVVSALRRWRWKPGTWKEIEVPVTFVRR
jgi:TonB family protein